MIERRQRAVMLVVEAVLAAAHQVEMPTFVAQGSEGEHGSGGGVFVGHGFGLEFHFVGDASGFDGPGAHLAPQSPNFRAAL